jgi:SAM-dependent methyltransferase
MGYRELVRRCVPVSTRELFRRFVKLRPTTAREESNTWLKYHAGGIKGDVLSIGSGIDRDGEGGKYQDYFKNCSSYTTSEVTAKSGCDLVLDVRSMPGIPDESFDCVFCSGVLEHVDDYLGGLREITRILKPGGILLLGLPFRQALHMAPNDYWRFTEYGIRHLLHHNGYEILNLAPIDNSVPEFPASYWVRAKKR